MKNFRLSITNHKLTTHSFSVIVQMSYDGDWDWLGVKLGDGGYFFIVNINSIFSFVIFCFYF